MTGPELIDCEQCGRPCIGVWAEDYLCIECFTEERDPIPQVELGEAQLVDATIDPKAGQEDNSTLA